jgi:hypothetical protein
MTSSSSDPDRLDISLDWCCTDHTPTSTMAHSVTQISNTVSPEIAASPGMSDILATVDPEIEASQLDYTFETATIENEEVPLCMSQSPQAANKPDELVLGLLTEIPRWVRGSVINFAAYSAGYPSPADAVYAAQQLNRAALYWNSKRVGVTFKWVGLMRSGRRHDNLHLTKSAGQKSRRRRLRPGLWQGRQPRLNRSSVLPQQHRPQRHARVQNRLPGASPTTLVAVLPPRARPRPRSQARVCARQRSGRLPVRASRSLVGDELPH